MPKSKKKPAPRPATKPSSPLPPEVLEQAAQGWLLAHGITAPAPPPSPQPNPLTFTQLTQNLDQAWHQLQAELRDLRARLARLESKKS